MDANAKWMTVLLETKDLPPDFWSDEEQALARLLEPLLRAAAVNGAQSSLDGLLEMGIGVDWALVNTAVVEWVKRYAIVLAGEITGTTRKFVQSAIVAWIESGQPIDELVDVLTPIFGAVRAELIAVTEVTRAFAEGNLATWLSSGAVSGKRWMTANDELVCPICAPLDGMVVELDSNGFTTETGGMGLTAPPAHPRCRCYLQPVVQL